MSRLQLLPQQKCHITDSNHNILYLYTIKSNETWQIYVNAEFRKKQTSICSKISEDGLPVIYNFDDFINILDIHKWQDWTKDLLTYDISSLMQFNASKDMYSMHSTQDMVHGVCAYDAVWLQCHLRSVDIMLICTIPSFISPQNGSFYQSSMMHLSLGCQWNAWEHSIK